MAGHIRKRVAKSGATTYQVIVEAGSIDPVTHKRNRIYKTFTKKKDAENALAKMVYDLNTGRYTDAKNITINSLMDDWLIAKKNALKRTTYERYREQVDWYIKPKLGSYKVDSLNLKQIQEWVDGIYSNPPTKKNGTTLSAKTVKNIYLNLKSALDYAVQCKYIPSNPCQYVNLPKQEKHEAESFTPEEVNQILTCAKGSDLYFPIYLLFNTGIRRGELLGLKWENVHIDDALDSYIEIKETRLSASGHEITDTPKSKSSNRKVFLGEQARKEFLKHRLWCKEVMLRNPSQRENEKYVIIKSDGKLDDPNNFTKRWNTFLKKNNLRQLKLHCCRHTCATILLLNNVDIKTISNRLGHADTTLVLNTYGHSLKQVSQAAANTMDSVLASATSA